MVNRKRLCFRNICSIVIGLSFWIASGASADQVTLQSQDGQEFKIDMQVAGHSQTLINLIHASGHSKPIPLQAITGSTLTDLVFLMQNIDSSHDTNTFQAVIENRLGKQPLAKSDAVFAAANFLHIQIILNGVAESIGMRLTSQTLNAIKSRPVNKDITIQVLSTAGLPQIARLGPNLWKVIEDNLGFKAVRLSVLVNDTINSNPYHMDVKVNLAGREILWNEITSPNGYLTAGTQYKLSQEGGHYNVNQPAGVFSMKDGDVLSYELVKSGYMPGDPRAWIPCAPLTDQNKRVFGVRYLINGNHCSISYNTKGP
jgi:hypothetical protein